MVSQPATEDQPASTGVTQRTAALQELLHRRRAILLCDAVPEAAAVALDAARLLATELVILGRWPVTRTVLGFHTATHCTEVTQLQAARTPGLLAAALLPDEHDRPPALLFDASQLTRNRDAASWRAFAPALRSHPIVIGVVPYDNFNRWVHLVELVHPLDQCVPLHGRWTSG